MDAKTDDHDSMLGAIAAGELAALEALYRDLRVAVFAVALAVVRDWALAEDVLQDTFVRVAERASTYRPGTRPRAWVLAIARNLAVDAVRRRRDPGWMDDRAEEADPLRGLVVTHALMALGPPEREIVALHALGGLTHGEIGAQLGIPPGTVRWKYRAALRVLAPLLTEVTDA